MNAVSSPDTGADVRRAVASLEQLILGRYPAARFDVRRGIDDPAAIHLLVSVAEDPDVVLDLVVDRMMQFQIDEHIPVFVIPMPVVP